MRNVENYNTKNSYNTLSLNIMNSDFSLKGASNIQRKIDCLKQICRHLLDKINLTICACVVI